MIEFVARELDMPVIRVLEVATFYFMYNLVPVGRFHVQVCGTTPCMLRGSDDLLAACKKRGMTKGHTTADGLWTLTEVECMGNCASAPMVQINDDNYEDLTAERLDAVLDALAAGEQPKTGTQEPGRHTVEPLGGPTTLKEMVDGQPRLPGGMVMDMQLVPVVVALIGIVIAWKMLKGLVKTVVLVASSRCASTCSDGGLADARRLVAFALRQAIDPSAFGRGWCDRCRRMVIGGRVMPRRQGPHLHQPLRLPGLAPEGRAEARRLGRHQGADGASARTRSSRRSRPRACAGAAGRGSRPA